MELDVAGPSCKNMIRPDDAISVYLFSNAEELLNAITRDKSGANLPLIRGSWVLQREMILGVQEPLDAGIDPEPALRGLRAHGYFIWHPGHTQPFGTGQ